MITFGLAILATLVFAFFDYVGFNTIKPRWFYRILQTIVQFSIYVGLYVIDSVWCSISFAILHGTFCADLAYYFFFDTIKWFGGDYAGKAYKNEVLGNLVTWAWWTPYGLITRFLVGKKDEPISGEIILDQAQLGFAIALVIGLVRFIF